jgi:hypothetical protein
MKKISTFTFIIFLMTSALVKADVFKCTIDFVGTCFQEVNGYLCENQTSIYKQFDWVFELNTNEITLSIKRDKTNELVSKSNIINIIDNDIVGRKEYTTDKSRLFFYQYKTLSHLEEGEFVFIEGDVLKGVNIFGKCNKIN